MPRLHPLVCALSALCLSVLAVRSEAAHSSFGFDVDSVDLVASSGSLSDDFDDGVISPWEITFGTASEAGGVASLTSPGTHSVVTDGGAFSVFLDRSDIQLDVDWAAVGEFSVTSAWVSAVPGPGESFGQFIQRDVGGGAVVDTVLVIAMVAPSVAATLGLSPGLQLIQYQQQQTGGITDWLTIEGVLVDEVDVTGDVLFRTVLDGSGNYTHSVSLDGGSSFVTPFADAFPALGGSGRLSLLAYEVVPEPGTFALVLVGLAGLGSVKRRAT